jgi:hypothetical protein
MNVYDFDQTIYQPDSSYSFFMHCLKYYTRPVLSVIPESLLLLYKHRRGQVETAVLKEQLFSFLPYLPDMEAELARFWTTHRQNIGQWYLDQMRSDDVIISASPEFLLRPIADALGVYLIATPMDPHSGRIRGRNCHDREKVRRFRELFPDAQVERFYSDSLSDAPMAALANEAFLVRKGKCVPWPKTGE